MNADAFCRLLLFDLSKTFNLIFRSICLCKVFLNKILNIKYLIFNFKFNVSNFALNLLVFKTIKIQTLNCEGNSYGSL